MESILNTFKKAVETAQPDLRQYYKMPKMAKIVGIYACAGNYYADVQPLLNCGNLDENEPIIPKLSIPVLWAGNNRGIVCPPQIDTIFAILSKLLQK